MNETSLISFSSKDGQVSLEVHLEGETVWLSLNELADLLGRDKSVISRHIRNIFKEQELDRNAVVAFFATTAKDGKVYQVEYFSLDLIISLGYRVNSKRGVEFRQWASRVLKQYLLQGYAVNAQQLSTTRIQELERLLESLSRHIRQDLSNDYTSQAVDIIRTYARSWRLIQSYDEQTLESIRESQDDETNEISKEVYYKTIYQLKIALLEKKETGPLFGLEKTEDLAWGIHENVHQTFGGKFLYPLFSGRAASLFYFLIKDHPFNDGNKRIASLMLLFYLKANNKNIEHITDRSLVSLALLVAQSDPVDKDLMIKLITHLIHKGTP